MRPKSAPVGVTSDLPASADPIGSASRGRRWLLKRLGATAVGACLPAAPWIMRSARSQSRQLHIMFWSDRLPESFRKAFERETGLSIVHTPYGSNEELLSRLRATRGRQFDVVGPLSYLTGSWKDVDLLQPLDVQRLPMAKLDARMLAACEGFAWDGRPRLIPFLSGTEGISWRTDRVAKDFNAQTYGEVALGDIWQAEFKGGVMGRPHSLMAGIGRQLASEGKLPPFEDSYRDLDTMQSIWSKIVDVAIARKPWIRQFWDSAEAQVDGFSRNGAVIGQTWDGPVLRLIRDGAPLRFVVPKEGAFSWVDGMAIPIGAQNIDGAYAFMQFALRPDMNALLASRTGYWPVVTGAAARLDKVHGRVLAQAFPKGSRDNLWLWPAMPSWYERARGQYIDRFITA